MTVLLWAPIVSGNTNYELSHLLNVQVNINYITELLMTALVSETDFIIL